MGGNGIESSWFEHEAGPHETVKTAKIVERSWSSCTLPPLIGSLSPVGLGTQLSAVKDAGVHEEVNT